MFYSPKENLLYKIYTLTILLAYFAKKIFFWRIRIKPNLKMAYIKKMLATPRVEDLYHANLYRNFVSYYQTHNVTFLQRL